MSDDPRVNDLAMLIWNALNPFDGISDTDRLDSLTSKERDDMFSAAEAVLEFVENGGLDRQMEEIEDWAFEIDLMDSRMLIDTYRNLGINDTMDGTNKRAQYITKRATEYKKAHPDEWNRITRELQKND